MGDKMTKSMKNYTSKNLMYFFNMFIFSISFANSCYMSILMNNEIKYSWLIPLALIIPYLILIFFIKKNYQEYENIKKKLITKLLLFSYSILSITLLKTVQNRKSWNLWQIKFSRTSFQLI